MPRAASAFRLDAGSVAPRPASTYGPDPIHGFSQIRDIGLMASSLIRLKRRAEFLRVAAKGRKAPMPGLVLQALLRDDEAPARLGFTVTKKVGNAVVRNRTRRRLKEAARIVLRDQPLQGVDLVLIGRAGTRSRNFRALVDDIGRAIRKTGTSR